MPTTPDSTASSEVDPPVVLVVEDNAVNQMVVEKQLQRLGYACDIAETGSQALESLGSGHPYGLILMDWQLPDIDGLEITRRYRALEAEHGIHVPVVAITASAMPEDRAACREAGMDGFLAKPVSLEQLEQEIRRVLPSVEAAGSGASTASEEDDQALADLVEDLGDIDIVASLVRTYLTELTTREERISSAVSEGDLDALHRVAHTLKSTSAMLGANDLADACRVLESMTDRNHAAKVVAGVLQVAGEARTRLTAWLNAHEDDLAASQ